MSIIVPILSLVLYAFSPAFYFCIVSILLKLYDFFLKQLIFKITNIIPKVFAEYCSLHFIPYLYGFHIIPILLLEGYAEVYIFIAVCGESMTSVFDKW